MTDTAISVQGLGKHYIIGHKKEGDFRHAIGNKLRNIFRPDASEKEIFWALKDIDFEIKHGEAVGIIGRNGAGKSTLLKILSRITDPSKGRFEINGRVSSLLEVGTGFHNELSGRENIYLNGTILGMKRAEIRQKFDEIVDFSGVEKFLDTPVKHYSSGMKVRLAFSVAAHLEPEILIVDEVLAVGDAEFQKKCLGKMDQVSKNEGRTVLFVSHNMGAVQNLCGRGIVLNQGEIVSDENINNAVNTYLSFNKQTLNSELQYRKDRRGNGALTFKNVSFYNAETEQLLDVAASGIDLKIRFEYSTILNSGEEVVFSIGFFTQQGVFLFACRSDSADQKVYVNGENTSECFIPNLPLRKGIYNYNIIAYHKGEVIDHIQDAGDLMVEAGDYYKTGKLPAGERPGLLVNYSWN
ncbi:MAG: ABC transporter ATP-binding protein [Bacteroidota bacterium]